LQTGQSKVKGGLPVYQSTGLGVKKGEKAPIKGDAKKQTQQGRKKKQIREDPN